MHGREPTVAEKLTIGTAGKLTIQLERSLSAEDVVKLTNTLARTLKRLGLVSAPQPTSAAERREAKAERILGVSRG